MGVHSRSMDIRNKHVDLSQILLCPLPLDQSLDCHVHISQYIRFCIIILSTFFRIDHLSQLNHTDPTIPHFRGESWSFVAGAAAGVDRPLMGWIGRFFFHNVNISHSILYTRHTPHSLAFHVLALN